MRLFRHLKPSEIECRISEISKDGAYLKLLLYKTARTDAQLLDETVSPESWQNDFKIIDGNLYGGIGIDFGSGYIWRWDCGTESNVEKEKGEASDAFKRAGFKWGIGAELYSSPKITINRQYANIKEYGGKFRCYDVFSVACIDYDGDGKIKALQIRNDTKGSLVWSMDAPRPEEQPAATEVRLEKKEEDLMLRCSECGEVLKPYTAADGKVIGIRRIAEQSRAKYGRTLCTECAVKAKAAEGIKRMNI